jgi:DNA mismatch repair protein MutL
MLVAILKPDFFPGFFLNLEVDPSSIDINIHPTKTEIKFDDEQTLYAILRSTIKHSLGQFSVAPVLDFDRDQNLDTPYSYTQREANQPNISIDASFNPFKNGGKGMESHPNANSVYPRAWERMYMGLQSLESGSVPHRDGFETEVLTSSIFEGHGELEESVISSLQLGRKFIVTTIKSGLLIIHQSRAHQRILYERFLRIITGKDTVSQQLLFPLSLSFTSSEIGIIRQIQDNLMSLGFVFGEEDKEQVHITGVPVLIPESEVGIILDQLISDVQQEIPGESFSQSDVLAKTLSKSLAVKSGELLDNASQLALVNDLFACKESELSPFNKPIYVTISEGDIEKKFI